MYDQKGRLLVGPAGKVAPVEALARLAADRRRAVAGANNNAAFEAGQLTQWMRPRPGRAVERRIAQTPAPGDNRDVMPFEKPPRSTWGEFPDVVIQAPESAVKNHPLYAQAKAGNIASAKQLVADVLSDDEVARIATALHGARPLVVAVHAIEETGINRIPAVYAQMLAERLGLDMNEEIVQINRVGHTGASGWHRLAFPALFDGAVQAGEGHLLVDDFVGQGGTLANLRGHLERNGGTVLLATTLTGKTHSAKLGLTQDTLERLRQHHGSELEDWWAERFGYRFDCLTESEARYLDRADDALTIRNRLLAARSEADR